MLHYMHASSSYDFHRLGKKTQEHPRPIVKFLHMLDAAPVLSSLDKIPSPFSIKPDMSPEQRLIENKLLKERYNLIQ